MPNYYAHLKFGDKVLEELPRGAGRTHRKGGGGLPPGLPGPGSPVLLPPHPAQRGCGGEGVRMHRASALPAAERLRQAIEDGVPMAAGYGRGLPLPPGPGQRLSRLCGQPGCRRPHLSHGHRGGVRPHAHGAGRPGRPRKRPTCRTARRTGRFGRRPPWPLSTPPRSRCAGPTAP